jgi:serine/threonine-protein kinase
MAEITKLGRYQIKGVLGRGAMGVVYEGLDPSLNRRVAIKTILKNAAIDAETAQMYSAQFAREAQAAGRLNHPNIVGVHDFAEEGEVAYLVMEFIQGRELRSFFDKKEKFEVAEVVRIMGELLDALDFAHEAGVIHRDVKPANVMLDGQRRVKLADFGVARIQDSERSAAGTMVGTPAFMSPEQIQGMKIDRRTDIFSAGTILYQLLTGEQPFTGAGAWTVAKKIMQDDPPQPSSVVQSVSPVFDAIVNKALAKKAADRFANAKEFAVALRGALGQPSAMASMPPMPVQKPRAAPQASETELEFWKAIQNSTDAAEFEFYLEQFPDGTYAALARHKIARLSNAPASDAQDTVRLEAEAAAKRRQAEAAARLEAEAKARREAEEKARQEAAAKAKREAETRARVEAELKAKREAEEKARQAQALAKLKQQEAARAAAADPDATVALARPAPPAPAAFPPVEKKKSYLVPAIAGTVVILAGAALFVAMNRKPAPAPVAETPVPAPAAVPAAPVKPAAPVVDEEKIRREVEERIRREYADKSAAEQAVAAKAATQKAVQEKQLSVKAAAEKALAEKLAAAKSAGEKAAMENMAAEKAAAEKLAAERLAAEKAAVEKAAAEKAAAERSAADKAAAEKLAAEKAGPSAEVLLERFIQRHGQAKVLKQQPPIAQGALNQGEVVYVNDGFCPRGQIRKVTGGNNFRNIPRDIRCIPLTD